MNNENYFSVLNSVNVSDKTEKKNGLTYLSWPWAWAEIKKRFPDTTYTIYENSIGWNYFTDGRTCWVKTGVTIKGIEHIEYLPVMDHRNRSIPAEAVTSYDVNKAIQRSITKAAARHGLGLYVYAGEDLPEDLTENTPEQKKAPTKAQKPSERTKAPAPHVCENCGKEIVGYTAKNGEYKTEDEAAALSKKKFGRVLCLDCMKAEAQKAEEPKLEPKPEQNGDPHAALKFRCEECGDELHMRTENGIAVPIREDAYRSKAIYGKVLCPKCQAIHDAAQPAPWESPEPLKWEDGRANAR